MNSKKIVITGGPGTGKTSIINELKKRGHICFEEVSRQVILNARKDGIEQLFLTNPMRFSELLLEGRIKQFKDASAIDDCVFLDRGIPDVLAYMDYIGDSYPQAFIDACVHHTYDAVFVLAPWEAIFTSDSERYETYEQAEAIHGFLFNTYKTYKYILHDVPFDTVEKRADFILNMIQTM